MKRFAMAARQRRATCCGPDRAASHGRVRRLSRRPNMKLPTKLGWHGSSKWQLQTCLFPLHKFEKKRDAIFPT